MTLGVFQPPFAQFGFFLATDANKCSIIEGDVPVSPVHLSLHVLLLNGYSLMDIYLNLKV